MILAMDVGNTNTTLCVYDGARPLHQWRLATVRERTEDELGMLVKNLFDHHGLRFANVHGVAISSVVPSLMLALERMCRRYFGQKPFVVGPGVKTGLTISKVENPREIGSDRIVNAVGAIEKYGPPLIVVDFGTATTFDVIDEEGRYRGGVIAPGIGISSEALHQSAAKLPRVELSRPASVVGRSTVAAMQSGIIFGFIGQVDGIVERIREEFPLAFNVVATGGLVDLIAPDSRTIQRVDANLTLDGLRIIWERNHG